MAKFSVLYIYVVLSGNLLVINEGYIFEKIESTAICGLCELLATKFYVAAKAGEPLSLLKLHFVPLCLPVESLEVCRGIFDVFAPNIIAALKDVRIGPKKICSMLVKECPLVSIPLHEWTITLSNVTKPPLLEKSIAKTVKPIKVLQISDIHLDLHYVVGKVSNCGEPLCCRSSSTKKIFAKSIPAERWATDQCDTPLTTLDYILLVIAQQHSDVDYIMWLGDIAPHDIWKQTRASQLVSLREGNKALKRFFPTTLVLPTIGNHEPEPDGCYPPPWVTDPKFSISWLSEELVKLWKDWIPPSQHSNVLRGGYYSIEPRPGLVIISLNTLYCHIRNWWLYVNSKDPANQLQWLANQLQQAESNGKKVHIIGHVPPGSADCLRVWSSNYYDIVNRYESTITAQFFGHTHVDEFEVFYDTQNISRPVNVAYIGPSITPFEGGNPSYRIYSIDSNTWKVLDYETWIMDFNKANKFLENSPLLSKFYSAKESYGLANLEPIEWSNFIHRLNANSSLFDEFYRNYYTGRPDRPAYKVKDKMKILCNLKSAKSRADKELCKDL